MWFQKNKWKIIVPMLVVVTLTAAFYFGGDAPSSKGWEVDNTASAVSTTPDAPLGEIPSPDNTSAIVDGEKSEPVADNTTEDAPEAPNPPVENNGEEQGKNPEQAPVLTPAPEAAQPSMEIDPETGKDPYLTAPVPVGNPLPVEPQDVTIGSAAYTCTISISCATILDHLDHCDPAKVDLVPSDGWILQPITVTFYEGESVFNVLQRVCKQQGIHMEFEDTPIYNSAYIEGIHNLYEFDVGELSGWMYSVNDWFPNYGCSRYQLRDGDVICWVYTYDLGNDVGGGYSAGNGRS